jgi:arsenite methyltransferase
MPPAAPIDRIREEFNRWARAGRGEDMEQGHLPIVLPLIDRLRLAPDDNVLDVGCGAGWLERLLAEQLPDGRVVGVDVSDEMICRARQRHADLENVLFAIGEVEGLPWDAGFFTRVVSVESAYYWPDPAAALREMFRVLQEGGSAWMLINYYWENAPSRRWSEILTVPTHLLSGAEWSAMFRAAGFTGVVQERIPDPTPVPETYSGRWFRDAAELRAFRNEGALLVSGAKPCL